MILNSQYSNFLVNLPLDFFPSNIVEKYTKFLKATPLPFKDLQSYINWTIQSISWAEIQPVIAEQSDRRDIKPFKGGFEAFQYTTREFDITFKTTESYLNYFILQDILLDFWEQDGSSEKYEVYKPDITLHLLDNKGNMLLAYKFHDIVFSGISALELSYAQNVPEFKTFNCTFAYRRFEIERNFD